MGASCLLTAILLIFCMFSFIALVGFFYLILGLVLYGGSCASLKNPENNVLREFDNKIDLNRYLPVEAGDSNPLRLSNAIRACQADENIFHVLRANGLYDINDISRIEIFTGEAEKLNPIFDEDLSKILLMTEAEMKKINDLRFGNLSSYHSLRFAQVLCTNYAESLSKFLVNLFEFLHHGENFLEMRDGKMFQALQRAYHNTDAFQKAFVGRVKTSIEELLDIVKEIDVLILYENHDFNETIFILMNTILKSEKFLKTRGKNFINTIATNLTTELNDMINHFINKVINECNNEVGNCKPLGYIYYQGVHFICKRLVDPINAFWFGILLCALLLLPIIYIAHRLMCLYLLIYPVTLVSEGSFLGCPICVGAPYIPPRVYTCGGGQQAHCDCVHGARP